MAGRASSIEHHCYNSETFVKSGAGEPSEEFSFQRTRKPILAHYGSLSLVNKLGHALI